VPWRVVGGWLGSAGGSVAAAVEVDGVGGVDESVEDGFGDDGVREQPIPAERLAVRCEDERLPGAFGDKSDLGRPSPYV